jgi:hypothetical protein
MYNLSIMPLGQQPSSKIINTDLSVFEGLRQKTERGKDDIQLFLRVHQEDIFSKGYLILWIQKLPGNVELGL